MNISKIIDISPNSFDPRPKVWSTLITLTPKAKYEKLTKIKNLEHVTKYFYLNKRKKSNQVIKSFLAHKGPSFLEVSIKLNLADNNLPRPKNLNQVIKKFIDK